MHSVLSEDMQAFINAMPKAELHVHLQGGTQPETLLKLATRHGIRLPAATPQQVRDWYTFRDFDHFIDIYDAICECIVQPDDIELVMREFIRGQAAQRIHYTEVTFTPPRRIPFDEQLDALQRAQAWGRHTYGVQCLVILDIPREYGPEVGLQVAEFVCQGYGKGVVALGIGGPELGNPASKFREAVAICHAEGIPCVPHAGETDSAGAIWDALQTCDPPRIGHGIRCLEDPMLVAELRRRGTVLEVCPTSNVLLKVAESYAAHPVFQLLTAGLIVTINSDDPPMFNVRLTDELQRSAAAFRLSKADLKTITMNAVKAALIPAEQRSALVAKYEYKFAQLG